MYRRRGPNDSKEMEDEVHMIENAEVDVASGSAELPCAELEIKGARTRIGEETHVIPHKFVKFKRRIITKVASPRGKLLYWWITVSFLGVLSFLLVLVPLLVKPQVNQDCYDQGDVGYLPHFYRSDGRFEICRQKKPVLKGRLGVGRSYVSEVMVNVFMHSMDSTLRITNLTRNCLFVQWVGLISKDVPICDCYEIGDSNWYGAYEHFVQDWPLNMSRVDPLEPSPFLPHDYLSDISAGENAFGPILHPLWLNTNGVGILVDEGVHLHVSMNGTQLCLIAQPFELECLPTVLERTFLNYTVCVFDTVAQTARYFLNSSGLIPRPTLTPSSQVFQKPIWSTWAEFKTNLTTQNINDFCFKIRDKGFNVSQLEVDDGYSQFYGELRFKPDVSIEDLLNDSCHGFKFTVWVHPFVNYNAVSTFEQGWMSGSYIPGVPQVGGNGVSLVEWWRGLGAVINFIDTSVATNHSIALSNFKKRYGLSSFKFDAGEYTYLPKCVPIEGLSHPGEFTKAYAQFVGNQTYSNRAEVRVGYFSQEQPILVRLLDRTSTWGSDNGLQSTLNAILSVGLGGYVFIIPDMIGGNGMTAKPSVELYVRWVQLNTFLPVMQFSITPWGYGEAVTQHALDLTRLHYLLEFDRLANAALESGFPIIRPLWWQATKTNDDKTWTISDQFFIGDEYMIAPVLHENQNQHTVYFPLGAKYSVVNFTLSAQSVQPSNIYIGGSTYTFNVSLYEILFFSVNMTLS